MIIWSSGIFYRVLLSGNISKIVPGIFLDRIYSLVCHQDPAKSIFISGNKLQVCARCTGIYIGGLIFSVIALIFSRITPRSKIWLLLSLVPMAADVILYSVGIYDYSKWIAFTTGLILGSASILYIFTGIEDYFSELKLSSDAR
jgi:uncharacterized membrane protein